MSLFFPSFFKYWIGFFIFIVNFYLNNTYLDYADGLIAFSIRTACFIYFLPLFARKVSKYGVISGPNTERYGPELTPNLYNFHPYLGQG